MLCDKILVVIKGFLSRWLYVYSGTTWKGDSELSYLEMRKHKTKVKMT